MGKLNVEVSVGGVKYRKVERDARVGDIIKATEEGCDITVGAYYTVTTNDYEELVFSDDGEDERDLDNWKHEVYEKVTEASTAAPSAPVKYREVKRKANVGERIKIVAAEFSGGKYVNGTELTVTEVIRGTQGIIDHVKVSTTNKVVLDREYVVLEPITEPSVPTQPERLKVGEYAKVIQERHCNGGKIVRITKNDAYSDYIYSTELLDGESADIHKPSQLVRATDAEVASAKQAASREAERTKAIGEFAEGGYAQITNANATNASVTPICNADAFVKVTVEVPGSWALRATLTNEDYGFCNADALRKITREEYEAATKPKPKFEVGEKVRLISGGGNTPLNGFTDGEIYTFVSANSDGWGGGMHKIGIGAQGQHGYAEPSQLEKVSAEEITKLTEEAEKQREEQKWNAIGRKVGEYKAGDVVRIVSNDEYNGVVGEVKHISSLYLGVIEYNGTYRGPYKKTTILIAPVESLFNATGGGRK